MFLVVGPVDVDQTRCPHQIGAWELARNENSSFHACRMHERRGRQPVATAVVDVDQSSRDRVIWIWKTSTTANLLPSFLAFDRWARLASGCRGSAPHSPFDACVFCSLAAANRSSIIVLLPPSRISTSPSPGTSSVLLRYRDSCTQPNRQNTGLVVSHPGPIRQSAASPQEKGALASTGQRAFCSPSNNSPSSRSLQLSVHSIITTLCSAVQCRWRQSLRIDAIDRCLAIPGHHARLPTSPTHAHTQPPVIVLERLYHHPAAACDIVSSP